MQTHQPILTLAGINSSLALVTTVIPHFLETSCIGLTQELSEIR